MSYIFIVLFIIIILACYGIYIFTQAENFVNIINAPEKNWIYKFFNKVYFITLPERLANVERMYTELHIEPTIFGAIPKESIYRDLLIKEGMITYDNILNTGKIACHLSHIIVLKEFILSGEKTCIIFEDDIVLEPNIDYVKKMSEIMSKVPGDWDMINFGSCWDDCNKLIKVNDEIVKSYKPYCRHAYAVTRRCASLILNHTIPMANDNGDKQISSMISNGLISCYSCIPILFKQNRDEFQSQLGNNDSLLFCI